MAGAKRHPVRGLVAGLLVGIGAGLLLIACSVIALGTLTPYLCVVGGAVAGVMWALVGPTRRRRGESDTTVDQPDQPAKRRRRDKTPEPPALAWSAPPEPEPLSANETTT